MIKKSLLLIVALLSLVSCTNEKSAYVRTTNESIKENNSANDRKGEKETIYQNVGYGFNYEKHCYLVYVLEIDKSFDMPPQNFYTVKVDQYNRVEKTGDILENEYFVNANELFVYVKQ